ncbi:MAG: hypothetical protein ACO1OG_10740 [Devosia sp.]
MAFREKTAWIAVVTTLVVWGYYFSVVWSGVSTRALDGSALWTLFLICMGVTVVLMLGLNLWAARRRIRDFGASPDELEKQFENGAARVTKPLFEWAVLGIAAAGLMWGRDWAAGFPGDPVGSFAIIIANALLFAGVTTNVLAEIIIIVRFRVLG